MKKKLAVLLGVLVLSSVSFAAPKKQAPAKGGTSIENSLDSLESQLNKIKEMEEAKFKEQERQAEAASQRLNNYNDMKNKIDERIAEIEASASTSIFEKEFKAKVAEYKNLKTQLDKEIAKEQKIIDNFEAIKSVR